jgi:hypothetical protein
MFELDEQFAETRRVATFATELKVAEERDTLPRLAAAQRLVPIAYKHCFVLPIVSHTTHNNRTTTITIIIITTTIQVLFSFYLFLIGGYR